MIRKPHIGQHISNLEHVLQALEPALLTWSNFIDPGFQPYFDSMVIMVGYEAGFIPVVRLINNGKSGVYDFSFAL
jgi:hypothetical protein